MIRIRLNWKYLIAFYCLTMLYASLHEMVHHFAGFLICGEWGYKTFNYFETACEKDNDLRYLATFAGPVFTFGVMYLGMMWLSPMRTNLQQFVGFSLIFAQLPAQRMINPLFRMNDEYYAASKLWGHGPLVYWGVFLIILIICLPPLIRAYQAIENKRRVGWFLFYFLLFPYLLFGPFSLD